MKKQYLTFNLDGQVYGFPIQKVCEINRIGTVTPVPNLSHHFAGVMNLRGVIISVISLRIRLGLQQVDNTNSTCSILVESGGLKVATIVDGVRSVVDIEESSIQPLMEGYDVENYIEGFARQDDTIVVLVDVDRCLFSDFAKEEYSKAAA